MQLTQVNGRRLPSLLRILASATQDSSGEGAATASRSIISAVLITIGRQQIAM